MGWVEAAKRAAILKALDEIRDARVVGIGSGTTLELLVSELAPLVRNRAHELKLVPTSRQIEAALVRAGVEPASPDESLKIDLALDGADQVASRTLDLIKGGGAALAREKIIDAAAERVIIVIDERKLADKLGIDQAVPVEVIPFAQRLMMSRLSELGGKPSLRYGNDGSPVTTDNGNLIIDVEFGPINDATSLETRLKSIPGVVETGLFLGMADRVYVGLRNGEVRVLEAG